MKKKYLKPSLEIINIVSNNSFAIASATGELQLGDIYDINGDFWD